MKKNVITRTYLESLSFSDLLALADTYGIDVPDNLNRRFLIGELLDVAQESGDDSSDMIVTQENDETQSFSERLPETYNVTEIVAVLRNPAWIYVYWDIGDSDIRNLEKHGDYTIFLRACSFSDSAASNNEDTYDVQITPGNTSEYFLCSPDKKTVRVELVASTAMGTTVLASSCPIEIPRSSKLLNHIRPGNDGDIRPITILSGMKELLIDHYVHHRESFL